jgi:DNA-binding response OmpR family regulator
MPKVLLIMGDKSLAGAYRSALEAHLYEVEHASQGYHAIQHALNFAPHLVILDVTLAGASGHDLLDILRQTPETSHAHIVLLDTVIDPASRLRANELGASGIFIKSQATVLPTVARVRQLVDGIHA